MNKIEIAHNIFELLDSQEALTAGLTYEIDERGNGLIETISASEIWLRCRWNVEDIFPDADDIACKTLIMITETNKGYRVECLTMCTNEKDCLPYNVDRYSLPVPSIMQDIKAMLDSINSTYERPKQRKVKALKL